MRVITTAAAVVLLSAACLAPPVPPLEPDDFTLSGVPLHADSAEIRLTYGEPDSVDTGENPFVADEPLLTWHYGSLEVRFSGDVAVGYMVSGGDEATLRGIRVGDPIDRVRSAYGEPHTSMPTRLTYMETDDEVGLRVVDFLIHDNVVTRIYVGAATP